MMRRSMKSRNHEKTAMIGGADALAGDGLLVDGQRMNWGCHWLRQCGDGATYRSKHWQSQWHPALALSLVALLLVAAGCSGGSEVEIAPVTGQVTLDGKPLADAQVIFRPEKGRPSTAITDTDGNYALQYSRDQAGALLGPHRVEIHTAVEGRDPPSSEKLPPRYNSETELTANVMADEKPINFELQSGS